MKKIISWFEITEINFTRAIRLYSDIFNAAFRKIIMRNYAVSFLLFLLITISITGCSNDSTDNVSQESTGDYWPTSVDNNWLYTQKGVSNSIIITGTEEINGSKYYKFDQLQIFGRAVDYSQPFSIKKNKGDYYIKVGERNITTDGVTYKITGYEFLFFKDYLDVNQTWTGTYNYIESDNAISNPRFSHIEGTYTGEILEKGISLTVNGTVFKDVIKFRFTQILDGKNDVWPTWDNSTDYWIAKDVGIIKFSYEGNISEHKSHKIILLPL